MTALVNHTSILELFKPDASISYAVKQSNVHKKFLIVYELLPGSWRGGDGCEPTPASDARVHL